MLHNRFRDTALCLGALAVMLFGARLAHADDRDFVRKAVENPYVFILLDVSGSMNWTTQCSAADLAAGKCRQLCGTHDCFAALNADDPASKFYQAKEALYEVLQQVDNVNFGFATYNQDALHVRAKHWLYKVTGGGVSLDGTTFPAVGAQEVFGALWNCDNNGTNSNNATDNEIGCYGNATDAGSLDDPWEMTRVQRLPKLGENGSDSVTVYVQSASHRFKVTYQPVAGETYGAPTFKAKLDIKRCSDSSSDEANENCDTTNSNVASNLEITYELVDQFLTWDAGADRAEIERGFFPQGNGADTNAGDTCNGWDANATADKFWEDPADDPFNGYDLRFPTTNTTDTRGRWFYSGDVLPLDWKKDNKAEILHRLAPTAGGFDQAPYFNDHPLAGESFLRLLDDSNKPFLGFGSTPLGSSIQSFRTWYAGCPQGTCPKNTGWKDVAAAMDTNWGCRKKYLIVLTDGDETCGGGNSACNGTAALNAQESIKTFVVAFGVQGGGSTLTCMAANGGTGSPIFPQNKKDLVDALTAIFTQVREETRAFASAAVPSVEANVRDKIFLSDFTPLNQASVWDGHLDAFLKPLPTDADGNPVRTPKCSASIQANCHLWDAGEVMEGQAALDTDLAGGNYRLGTLTTQRRVLYPTASGTLKGFEPPAGNPDWFDLFDGLGFKNRSAAEGDGSPLIANRTRATDIIKQTLRLKTETVNLPDGTSFPVTYVLGDIFHSNPVVLESPTNFADFAGDEFGRGLPCDLTTGSDPGYKCFAFKHKLRRKLLLAGVNDSQLHAFDAGAYSADVKLFGNGTGLEAFSFIPRMTLPIVRDQAEGDLQIFGVDGPVTSGDIYLRADNAWHTVVAGGLREGGIKLGGGHVLQPESGAAGSENLRGGYFLLDVTQPDPLRTITDASGAIVSFEPNIPNGGNTIPPALVTAVPRCSSLDGVSTPSGVAGPGRPCPAPFPKLLWEFTDRSPGTGQPLDEDANGDGDLGEPWAQPVLTRIKVRGVDGAGNPVDEVRFVAIVGGGLDRNDKTGTNPAVGNWIYMIDMETGKALYKREVEGSVPAVSALDTDFDNICDFVYFGTTAGRVYKIDTRSVPTPATVNVRDRAGVNASMLRIQAPDWTPLKVFQAGELALPQPIYMPIQLVFVARLSQYALAFGPGDRANLWNFDGLKGRFYTIVDQDWSSSTPGLPLDETSYQAIATDAANLSFTTNLLLNPALGKKPGWFIALDPNEKIITKAFAVSNIVIFSSFQPQIIITEEGNGNNADTFCSRTGTSRNFVVLLTNANAIADLDSNAATGVSPPPPGPGPVPPIDETCMAGCERNQPAPDFVTSPFVEQTQTQNPGAGPPTAQQCTADPKQKGIIAFLKSIGPRDARYGNYFMRIGQRQSKGRIMYPACIPIGVAQANWREN